MLVELNVITPEQCRDAMSVRIVTDRPLADVLVEKAYVTRAKLEEVMGSLPDSPDDLAVPEEDVPPEVGAAERALSRRFGKYVLLEELGRGGAGVVHKAWDALLGDYVALKLLREPTEGTPAERRRLRRELAAELIQEARVLRMRHAHILPILDVGRIGRQIYVSMEYVEGRTLADHIAEARERGRVSPLYEDPVAWLSGLRDVCDAVHYAHTFRRPLVHCDLKPGNVLVSRAGTPYVMDFGLARPLDLPADAERVIRGTPAYMAPEQLTGRAEDIGVWTDVYGLGGILYEMLTGRAVFADAAEVGRRALTDRPRRPTEIIRDSQELRRQDTTLLLSKVTKLETVCLRCLAPEPRERYASARAIAEEIELVIAGLQAGRRRQIPREKAAAPAVRGGTDVPERFRDRLARWANERRPTLAALRLNSGVLLRAEILKATPEKLVVWWKEDARVLEWGQLSPVQLVELIERLPPVNAADRAVLGMFCRQAGLHDRAARYLVDG